MRIFAAIYLAALATSAHADEHATWMCLFENVPVSVVEPADTIQEKQLTITMTNDLSFPISKAAVDFVLVSEEGAASIEQSIVLPFPAHLQPGETRALVAYLSLSDAELSSVDHPDLTARAATANVLDSEERRMVLRENLGASFRVFWPTQQKSDQTCD